MYTLYWHPSTSSLAPMAVLEELGMPFELYQVDYEGGECDTPEYRQLQPLGLIPSLQLANGHSMFESAAIVQYLSDLHGIGTIAPAFNDTNRAYYLQWLYYMADTIFVSYNRYYRPERYTTQKAEVDGIKQQARQVVLQQWTTIENLLNARGPWLLGKYFSACDIYLQMMTTWHDTPKILLDQFPHIRQVVKGVVNREACYRAIQRHSFATGLE